MQALWGKMPVNYATTRPSTDGNKKLHKKAVPVSFKSIFRHVHDVFVWWGGSTGEVRRLSCGQ